MNSPLRVGPDGTLYCLVFMSTDAWGWMPVATPAGKRIPPAAQRRGTHWPFQPVAGGLRMLGPELYTPRDDVAPHELRYALIDRRGRVVRSWRILSSTELNLHQAAPELVGGDPLVVLAFAKADGAQQAWEYEVLRLGPHGVRSSLTLPARLWGDTAQPDLRVGPDGSLYQLATSPTAGVTISRYCSASERPDPRHERFDVDGDGGVHLDQTADAQRLHKLVVPQLVVRSTGVEMSGMSPAAAAIAAEGKFARAAAADLDDRTGKRRQVREHIAVEVALEHSAATCARDGEHRLDGGSPDLSTPLHRVRRAECVHQRLLDRVLGDQRQLQPLGERAGECRLSRPGRAGDEDEQILGPLQPRAGRRALRRRTSCDPFQRYSVRRMKRGQQ